MTQRTGRGQGVPRVVREQCGIARLQPQLVTGVVQRRDTEIAAAGDVDRGEVERGADEVVAEGSGDELVDLVAALRSRTLSDVRCCDEAIGATGVGASARERKRVEEAVEQADRAGVLPRDRLVEHGVTQTVDRLRELHRDIRVDRRVVRREGVNSRLDLAHEGLEDQVLVLVLVHHAGGLEQPLAQTPARRLEAQTRGIRCRQGVDLAGDVGHEPVVLGVEHCVDRGQADVLVASAVTGDEVRVKQLVVVLTSTRDVARRGVGVGKELRTRLAVDRHRKVRDVVQEGVPGALRRVRLILQGDDRVVCREGAGRRDRAGEVALDHRVDAAHDGGGHQLRKVVGPTQVAAVLVREEQRHAADVGVTELDAQHVAGLLLDIAPRADVAGDRRNRRLGRLGPGDRRGLVRRRAQQVARGHRTVDAHLVLTDEDLLGRRRGVGLILVDPGGRPVRAGRDLHVRQAAGHEHGTLAVQRILRLSGRELDELGARLADEVQAVVEELAEEGEHRVGRRRDAGVGGDVQDLDRPEAEATGERNTLTVAAGGDRRGNGGRVRVLAGFRSSGRHVGDQVADHARRVVDEHARRGSGRSRGAGAVLQAAVRVGRRDACSVDRAPLRHGEARERLVGRARVRPAHTEVVVPAVNLTNAVRQVRRRDVVRAVAQNRRGRDDLTQAPTLLGCVRLGDLDLLEDEGEVRVVEDQLT